MLRSWRLGRLFGIDVYVHWTFLLVVGWLAFSSRDEGLAEALTMGALGLAVGGCVLLHEFGHALMARFYGIATRDVTLYPIGGIARLEGVGRRPGEEAFIALAGPAVNLALGVVLAGLLTLVGVGRVLLRPEAEGSGILGLFLTYLLLANLMLAFFNLLPAFPMDGGRVLRSVLAVKLGRLRATEIAARLGMVLAVGLILLPGVLLVLFDMWTPMLMLIGLFVWFAGRQELLAARRAEAASRAAQDLVGDLSLTVSVHPGKTAVFPNGHAPAGTAPPP